MGSFQGGLQILSSAIKLPALYLLTTILSNPIGKNKKNTKGKWYQ